MSAHSPMLQQASLLSGRQSVMLLIIALHGLVIALLMSMRIVPDVPQPQPPPIIGHFDPPETVVPPPPDELVVELREPVLIPLPTDFRPEIPPEVRVSSPVVELPYTPADSTARVADPVVPAPPRVAMTALQYRAVRPASDYYPSASLSLQEEGVAVVQVCVSPSGQLSGDPIIQQSAGSPRLDAAAVKWAREALRFTPATQGGVAIAACKGFRVTFSLR